MGDIIASLVFLILSLIVVGWGLSSYHEDADGAALIGFVILVFSIIGLGDSIKEYNKSPTAKKYARYLELKRQNEKDSIINLHDSWEKDLDRKINKLKNEI